MEEMVDYSGLPENIIENIDICIKIAESAVANRNSESI